MADLGLWFYVVMGLVLVGLIGVFLYLRKKGDED
jgi:LPXTG-motif cell wall-anchored protein